MNRCAYCIIVSIPLRKFLRRAASRKDLIRDSCFHPSKEVFEAGVATADDLGTVVSIPLRKFLRATRGWNRRVGDEVSIPLRKFLRMRAGGAR